MPLHTRQLQIKVLIHKSLCMDSQLLILFRYPDVISSLKELNESAG